MNKIVDVASLLVVVTAIMVLVRPGSQGPAFVDSVGRTYIGALTVASGSGVPSGYNATPWN